MSGQPGSGNSSSQQGGRGNAQHEDAISVGGLTSGEAGATPQHETLSETGGSGGDGLTRNEGNAPSDASEQSDGAASRQGWPPEDSDRPVCDSGARGAQDTRSRQAGWSATGLGVPETGANQTPEDVEHKP